MILASVGHCAPDKCQCLSLALPRMEQVVEDPRFEIMMTKHDEASQRPQFAPLPVCWFCCLFDGVAAAGGFSCSRHTMPVTFNVSDTNIYSSMAAFSPSARPLTHC